MQVPGDVTMLHQQFLSDCTRWRIQSTDVIQKECFKEDSRFCRIVADFVEYGRLS